MKASTIQKWSTIVWCVLVIPTMTVWRDSIPWVSFMSIYAIIISHYTAYKASKTDEDVKHE